MLTLVTHVCPQVWVITIFINNAVSTLPPPSYSDQRVDQDTMSLAPLSPWASVATAFGSVLLLSLCVPRQAHVVPSFGGATAVDSVTTVPNGWAGPVFSRGPPARPS